MVIRENTKNKLKKAIKKSDLYGSAFFYFGNYPTDYASRTLKKELKGLLKDIIEIMELIENNGVNDGNN